MKNKFWKTNSGFFAAALIGLIIVSFMFGGYNVGQVSVNTIAKINDHTVSTTEYQRAFNAQLQRYSQIFGGKSLTRKQIEQFKLKDNVINQLVNEKLMLIYSAKLGLYPGTQQIKSEIKKLPYFQTNKNFDIQRYKQLLQRNGMTPADFEEDTSNRLKLTSLRNFIEKLPVSKDYVADIRSFKEKALKLNMVRFSKENLKSEINVSQNEITAYLGAPDNSKKIEDLFNSRKNSLSKKEEIKARHILLKTTPKNEEAIRKKITLIRKTVTKANFSKIASKATEDPSGKGNGGSLDWFARGRMVPAFEKQAFSMKPGQISDPVKTNYGYHIIYVEDKHEAQVAKLEDHRNKIAKELIQDSRANETTVIAENLTKEIEGHLANGNMKKVEAIKNKYQLTIDKERTVNQVDEIRGIISLEASQINKLYKERADGINLDVFHDAVYTTVVSSVLTTGTIATTEEDPKGITGITNQESQKLTRQMNQELLDSLQKDSNVKIYHNRIL
jgi:peptidyl-prolyl cis-trans isomerase D